MTVPKEEKASVRDRSSTDHDNPAPAIGKQRRSTVRAMMQSGIIWETDTDAGEQSGTGDEEPGVGGRRRRARRQLVRKFGSGGGERASQVVAVVEERAEAQAGEDHPRCHLASGGRGREWQSGCAMVLLAKARNPL